MIRLGLRLTLAGGREALTRLVIVAVAVALGVGLLLVTVAGIGAVSTQNARYAWLNTGQGGSAAATVDPAAAPLWWLLKEDYFHGRRIGQVDLAATGPTAPVPSGIDRLPGPGEFYASPALTALLRTTPAAELGDRFPGHQIGTVGPAALPAPDSLLVIVGHAPDELARLPGARQVTAIATTSPDSCDGCVVGMHAAGIDLILSVIACALLFPLLMFIGTANRLSVARREQRFAAMRLVGATPGQVSVIAAVESTFAATVGMIAGFGVFFLLRSPVAAIPFTGEPFFPADLSLGPVETLLVAIGVPVAAAVAALLALRRVHLSPLGVTRRVTPRAPRAWRVLPLLAGLAELGYFAYVGKPHTTDGQVRAFVPGFLLIMVGLVVAGPWLTLVGSRLLARRTGRPATLIATRRLSDNPKAGFRAVGGLVLALFVTSAAVAVITSIVADRGDPHSDATTRSTLIEMFGTPDRGPVPPPASATPAALGSIPGVLGVTVTRSNPAPRPEFRSQGAGPSPDAPQLALVSCADLARTPAFGRCAPGAEVAEVDPSFADLGVFQPAWVWRTATVSADELRSLPLMSVVVSTDGSAPAIERARTVLEAAYPGWDHPATLAEWRADTARRLVQWQQLANVVILASLPIAGCSLAVSVVAGLSDRKRSFSLLRLTGVPIGMLRGVIALESAVPLLAAAAVAIGAGFGSADLFLHAQMRLSLVAPGIGYYVIVLAGLAGSLGVIVSTLPLLRRITGTEAARNE